MKTKQVVFAVLHLVILIFSSCHELEYIPNVLNTPLFSDKGEFQVASHGSIGSEFEPQLSYSVTNHIGLMLNGSFSNTVTVPDENSVEVTKEKHSFVELGTGYFSSLSPVQRFEIYGGIGYGDFWRDDNYSTLKVNCNRIFIQPALGMTSRYFDLSFASKFVLANYLDGSYETPGGGYIGNIDFSGKSRFSMQPAITTKIGINYVKVVLQLGCSIPFYSIDPNELVLFDYFPLLSLGLQVNVDKLLKKSDHRNVPDF